MLESSELIPKGGLDITATLTLTCSLGTEPAVHCRDGYKLTRVSLPLRISVQPSTLPSRIEVQYSMTDAVQCSAVGNV